VQRQFGELARQLDPQLCAFRYEADLLAPRPDQLERLVAGCRVLQRLVQALDALSIDLGQIGVDEWSGRRAVGQLVLQLLLAGFERDQFLFESANRRKRSVRSACR
jgi:hypothetical protein